jgi:hypothetical protein
MAFFDPTAYFDRVRSANAIGWSHLYFQNKVGSADVDRERQLQRYALALSLVADPDVAGDLFMDARDEADLIRRAARWREARGEGPVAAGAPLPLLTPDQEEHALHLARRATLRRRSRRVIGIAGAALAVLAAGALLLRLPAAPVRAKPKPAPAPQSQTVDSGGLHLAAYQVEVTPGTVTVTWGARWDGPEQPVWRPALVVGSLQPQRVRPLDTEFLGASSGEVRARSTFRAVADPGAVIWLVLETPDDRDIVLSGLAATESGVLPSRETLPVGQHLSVGPDRDVLIETVTLTSEYTEVRYALPDALAGAGWPHAEVELVLQAGGQTLRGYGVRDLSANGSPEPERTEYFPPLAAVSAFRIVARVHPPADQSRFVYRFEDTGAISEWHRTTTGLVVTVAGIRTMAPAGGFVTDAAGGQYAVDFDCVSLVEGRLRRSVRVEGFPTDARPVTLTLVESSGAEALPGGSIEVPVPDGNSR